MLKTLKSLAVYSLITSLTFLGFTQSANATLITTEQLAAYSQAVDQRHRLNDTVKRTDVAAQLEHYGLSKTEAQQRIAALTDEEVLALNDNIDQLPAGSGVVGAVVFVFLVLLVTDILGFTKVFPFTKPVSR
jgi:hypothetical protein